MNKTRIKILLPTITTRAEAETAMNELAIICNNERKEIARRDAAVLEVNRRHEDNLSAYAIAKHARTEILRAWAEASPDQFPKGRKSLDLVSGVLGFRTGTPKLTLLSRAFTWEKVLGLMRAPYRSFIRIKEEVDKELMLSAFAAKTVDDAGLRSIGLRVVQEESFFVEPNLSDMETRQTTPAS